MKINNKGFTLIEVMAAVVILGIITGLSIPVLKALHENNERKKYETYGESLISAAKLYVDSYKNDIFTDTNFSTIITYKQLKSHKFITNINEKGITCNSNNTFVKVTKDPVKKTYTYNYYLGCGSGSQDTKLNDSDVSIVYPRKDSDSEPYTPKNTYLIGDTNGDEKVDNTDLNLINDYVMDDSDLNDDQTQRSDTNDDNIINIKDLNCLSKFLNGEIDKLPCKSNPILDNLGDVDGDKEVTAFDASLIQRYLAFTEKFTAEQKLLADTDQDGVITVFDVTCIQDYIVGKQKKLPCK